ncbi:MAG: response regulator [Gammaproteobacteria bacterium]
MDERGGNREQNDSAVYTRFFEHAPDMLAVVDATSSTIRACNTALATALGRDADSLVGRDVMALFHPDCKDSINEKLDGLAQHSTAYCNSARLISATGRSIPVFTHIGARSGQDDAIEEIYLTFHAASLHQDAEKLELELRLQAAQKMESLAMLATGVAHDFNNFLITIIGNAGLAAIEMPSGSPALSKLKDIELASSRAAELTKQLMAYSSPRDRGPEIFDLSKVVGEMSHLLEIAIAQKANLNYELSDKPLAVKGDVTQIRQIIMNLLTNSADAMSDKRGLIAIRTGSTHLTERYLMMTLTGEDIEPGHYAYVEVADTGVGLTTEQQVRMFEPFFTTKSKGHGLGLAAVLGIVRQHGGTLRVYSEPGSGTTIKVYFPIIETEVQPQEKMPRAREPQGEHILIVDDEETVCVIAERVLRKAGFRVSVCRDGHEALAVLKRQQHNIDLVLMDIAMPYLSGTDTFKMIQKQAPNQRVMLMSAFDLPSETHTIDAANYAGFLEKPFEATKLITTVTAAIDT